MKIGSGSKKALLLILLMLALGTQVIAEQPFFPLAELKPGMKGQGYTVFSGTKVEPFPIEVVGIMEGRGALSRLVLIKLTGGQMVAAGMSGSPVFIDGKLVGAIGYGFENADSRYAIVTPIDEMLSLWRRQEEETFTFTRGGLPGYAGVTLGKVPPEGSWLVARPVATPLFLSGYGARAGEYLLTALKKQGALLSFRGRASSYPGLIPALQPLALTAPGAETTWDWSALQPGSALSLTLVEGDYKVTALGTLTWREGNRFLGFGHSFMNKGWVEYGVGSASIIDVIDSREFPFKLGVASPSFGRVSQDRSAGIAGEFGVLPRTVRVETEVTDEATGEVRNFAFTVVNDEDLLPGLVLSGVLDTIDRTLDRIGPGTAQVYFELNGANFSSFQRENLFYGQDVAAAALLELAEMLQVVTGNEFVRPELTGVKLSVKISPEQRWARINRVDLPQKEFAPGEKVTLMVELLPFRGAVVETPLEVTLPETPGKWLLMVYGNQYYFSGEEKESNNEELNYQDLYPAYTSLEEKLADYRQRPQNNQLMVEILPAEGMPVQTEAGLGPEVPAGEKAKADPREELDGLDQREEHNYQMVATSYFVTGQKQIVVEVVAPAETETGESAKIEVEEEHKKDK